jgi:hypothetical protein
MAPYTQDFTARGWIYNVATGFYAIASASGSFFFALNFGSEGMRSPLQFRGLLANFTRWCACQDVGL